MANQLPKSIVIGPDQLLFITEKELPKGKLGYFDPSIPEIAIESRQPEVGKHHILLHEMIHLAVEKLKQGEFIKRAPSEAFVSYLTGALFPMLAMSGLWNGVTPEEAEEFAMMFEDGEGETP